MYRQVHKTRLSYVESVVGAGNFCRLRQNGNYWIRIDGIHAGLPDEWAIFMSEYHDVSEALQGVPRVYLARHATTSRGSIHCGPTAGIPWQREESGPWTPECSGIPNAAISPTDPPEWVLRRRDLGFCRRASEPAGSCPADRHTSADGTKKWFLGHGAGLHANWRFVVSLIEWNDDGSPIVTLQRWPTIGTPTNYCPGDPNIPQVALLRGPLNRQKRAEIGWIDPPVSGTKHPRDEENEELQREVKEAKQELRELKDAKLCSICMIREKTHAVMSCRHLCLCAECALEVSECPMCRTPFPKENALVRIYH